MPKPSDHVQMSSIIPRFLVRKAGLFIERHLPLRKWDMLNHFWVQTRLIFSRAILLLVLALTAFFSSIALGKAEYINEEMVFELLIYQVSVLAILLNMSLWEVEREGRTFELLIMRIPNLHRLIWFKLRVSIFWMIALSIPFFAAYGWFLSIPFYRIFLFFLFIATFATLITFATCVVSSFVHHGLTSGIVTFILSTFVIAISRNARLPYIDFYSLAIQPFQLKTAGLSVAQTVWLLIANRCVLLLVTAGFYFWLHRRLGKTEKWIQ